MPTRSAILFCLIILLTTAPRAVSQERSAEENPDGSVNWHRHKPFRAWMQPFDSTLLAQSLAFGIQVEVPLNWAEIAGEEFSGLGDLESRIGLVGPALGLRWGLPFKLPMTVKITQACSFCASYRPKWNLADGDTDRDLLEQNAIVLKQPVSASREQLQAFAERLSPNNRPVQPPNDRRLGMARMTPKP